MASITRTIKLNTDEGEQVFPVKQLDFYNLVCDLEGAGIDVMTLTNGTLDRTKLFSTVRALLSVMIGVPQEQAGTLIGQHIANDGSLEDVFSVFTEAMNDAGFGNRPTPQDHKKPQTAVSKGRKKVEK